MNEQNHFNQNPVSAQQENVKKTDPLFTLSIILTVTVLVVLLASLVGNVYKNKDNIFGKKQKPTENQDQQTPSPKESEVYLNDQYGYSLTTPKDWQRRESYLDEKSAFSSSEIGVVKFSKGDSLVEVYFEGGFDKSAVGDCQEEKVENVYIGNVVGAKTNYSCGRSDAVVYSASSPAGFTIFTKYTNDLKGEIESIISSYIHPVSLPATSPQEDETTSRFDVEN